MLSLCVACEPEKGDMMQFRELRIAALTVATFAALALGCDDRSVVGGQNDGGADVTIDTTPVCAATERLCSGRCLSVRSDNDNCGACGNQCALSQRCVEGACRTVCPSGQQVCAPQAVGDAGVDGGAVAEVCAILATDNANCGACGRRCAPGQVCSEGTCRTSCAVTLATCSTASGDPTCADLTRDPQNCGSCGHACASGEACVAGACMTSCPSGMRPSTARLSAR